MDKVICKTAPYVVYMYALLFFLQCNGTDTN